MSKLRPVLRRSRGPLLVFCASVAIGAAFRYGEPVETSYPNPHTFTAYTLQSREPVSATSSILTLRAPDGSFGRESLQARIKDAVWSVQIRQPQLQVARSYTPLPTASTANGSNEVNLTTCSTPEVPIAKAELDKNADAQFIRLLLRHYPSGELSHYLHMLPLCSPVDVRGPFVEFYLPQEVDSVIFLAAGTGISPALQVADMLRRRQVEGKTRSNVRILWANRRREDCAGGVSDSILQTPGRRGWWPWSRRNCGQGAGVEQRETRNGSPRGTIVAELEALKTGWNRGGDEGALLVDYFVDEEGSYITPSVVRQCLNASTKCTTERSQGKKLLLVSGPEGFIAYWAGRKLWAHGGEQQGPIEGVLSELNINEWQVWKL
ncbi:hypothetical protein BDY21DRAFT_331233 [Lineolata rhizophorae]|uniref:FAD-binding FR-type domain-containing protein n=1 Tax=Lineolata rhizophorae TaxID=578093 RepID=A0A6A6PF42_9PEZI|nr:hypothetical protein BDY21DRAFT_331233 [Lineolata rhizophorae]